MIGRWPKEFDEPSNLLIAVNCLHGEGWQTDGDIFRATLSRGGILDPFASMGDDRLACGYVHLAVLCRTRTVPLSTRVNSSNSGVCPGSSQPCGLRIWATLTPAVLELMRPMYSSMSLGLVPAAEMRVGCAIKVGMSAPLRRITVARRGTTSEVKDD